VTETLDVAAKYGQRHRFHLEYVNLETIHVSHVFYVCLNYPLIQFIELMVFQLVLDKRSKILHTRINGVLRE